MVQLNICWEISVSEKVTRSGWRARGHHSSKKKMNLGNMAPKETRGDLFTNKLEIFPLNRLIMLGRGQ